MKIAIIGTGYVGLPTGVGLASWGNEVVCIDKNEQKIEQLNAGNCIIYEDGMEELFRQVTTNQHLKFSTSMQCVEKADIVLLSVGTPPHPVTKEADLQYIYAAAKELAPYLSGYTVVATKSTVPVGTGDEVEAIIKTYSNAEFDVISLPEFLREGFAVHDFFNPDRIVIGTNAEKPQKVIKELYAPVMQKTQMLFVQ